MMTNVEIKYEFSKSLKTTFRGAVLEDVEVAKDPMLPTYIRIRVTYWHLEAKNTLSQIVSISLSELESSVCPRILRRRAIQMMHQFRMAGKAETVKLRV